MSKLTKGQRTREKILKSALRLFAREGFASTSIQKIADQCGISQTAVLQHYSSKKNLLEAIRLHVNDSNWEFVDKNIHLEDDALTSLTKHCSGNLEWALKNKDQAQIIILFYYYGCFDQKFRQSSSKAIEVGTNRIKKYLLAAQRESLISSDEDVERLADIIHEHLLGAIVRNLAGHKKISREKVFTLEEDFISRLIAKK